jgi:hypothetical protein
MLAPATPDPDVFGSGNGAELVFGGYLGAAIQKGVPLRPAEVSAAEMAPYADGRQ